MQRTDDNLVQEKTKAKKGLKREHVNDRTTGIWLRKSPAGQQNPERSSDVVGNDDGDFDFKKAALEGSQWECPAGCQMDCCNGRIDREQIVELVEWWQNQIRGASKGGQLEEENHWLCSRISCSFEKIPKKAALQRRKKISKAEGYVKKGCSWCNTVRNVGPYNKRKHKCTEKCCPLYKDMVMWVLNCKVVQWQYSLPNNNVVPPGNPPLRPFQVPVDVFKKVYGIGYKRLRTMKKRYEVREVHEAQCKSGGCNYQKLNDQVKKELVKVMNDNLSLTEPHYIKFDDIPKKKTFAQNVTRVSLWKEFCKRHDKPFYEQSSRLGYWHGVDHHDHGPSHKEYEQDQAGMRIKPKISYKTAAVFFGRYNVRFGKLRVDVCQECEKLQNDIINAKSDEEREAAIQAQRKHKMKADFSYKLRQADHKRALDKHCSKYFSCADIDFAGGFRNPWLPIQIAYYKRICPMTNFIIAGPDFVDMYGYDETIAGKGPDEVCSFVYHWLKAEKEKKPNLKHVVFWCDSCAGQSWNQYLMRLIHEVTNPLSDFYIEGIERIDLKKAMKGHSYLWCDRIIGPIKQKARRCHNGIVASFITKPLKTKYHHRTWQHCIETSKLKNKPYNFHRVKQEMIFAFKEYWGRQESVLVKGPSYDSEVPSILRKKISGENYVTSARSLKYHNKKKFQTQDICWVSAGVSADVSADNSEGLTRHNGQLWCRTSFSSSEPWMKLSLFRKGLKQTRTREEEIEVTEENYQSEKEKHGKIKQLYNALLKLPLIKVKDLHDLGRAIAPKGCLDEVYPAANEDELKKEMKASAAAKKAKKSKSRGKKRKKSDEATGEESDLELDFEEEHIEARKKQRLVQLFRQRNA